MGILFKEPIEVGGGIIVDGTEVPPAVEKKRGVTPFRVLLGLAGIVGLVLAILRLAAG